MLVFENGFSLFANTNFSKYPKYEKLQNQIFINKYFEIPRVQIQIGARNLKSWLITKYLSRTK